MKEDKKKDVEVKITPGEQGSAYEGADPETVKQDVKELNDIGAPGEED